MGEGKTEGSLDDTITDEAGIVKEEYTVFQGAVDEARAAVGAREKDVVFYGDYLWLDEAKRQGGFLATADAVTSAGGRDPITGYSVQTQLNRNKFQNMKHPESYI
ncbi:hypothetical protein CDD83_9216 [Cordyceps sp. RAO-2017]|nr:hypothetical protein CDD83_9216 [Cordyceps sp. RAO-2017]